MPHRYLMRILLAAALTMSAAQAPACDIADDEGKDFFSPMPKRGAIAFTPMPSRIMSTLPLAPAAVSFPMDLPVSRLDIAVAADSRTRVPRGSF